MQCSVPDSITMSRVCFTVQMLIEKQVQSTWFTKFQIQSYNYKYKETNTNTNMKIHRKVGNSFVGTVALHCLPES